MESPDIEPGPAPVDPDYAGLFRPEPDEAIVIVEPAEEARALIGPAPRVEPDEPDEPDEPIVPAELVDTGRLFRSQGVVDHHLAVLAVASSHGGRLRTLVRSQPEPMPLADPIGSSENPDQTSVAVDAVILDETGKPSRASRRPRGRSTRPANGRARERAASRQSGRITGGAVYLIVIGVTVLVGFANAILLGGHLGWPTGVALVVSSVYCALTVHRDDDSVAIITPPVAFLAASLTAGQLFLGSAEGSLLNRAVVVFFSLADNWYWIIGATVAALVIVLVRRRRA